MNELREIMSSSFDQDLLLKGWFENHATSPGAELPVTPEAKVFLGLSWPMSELYRNPLGAIWAIQILTLELLNSRESWILRDGLIPLLWFFHRFPKPGNLRAKLFVDEELAYAVPEAWVENFGTYRVHSTAPQTASSRGLILTSACDVYCSLKEVSTRVREIVARESAHGVHTFDLFAPARTAWKLESEQSYHPAFYRDLWKHLPEETRILTRSEVMGTFDAQNLRVYDLNEKLLVSDNWVVFELLVKGAQWARSKPLKAGEEFQRLSPSHGYVINRRIQNSPARTSMGFKTVEEFHRRLQPVLDTTAFRYLPWPEWFPEWVKVTAESAQRKKR